MLLSIQVAFFEIKQVDIFIESLEELSAEIPTIYDYGTPAISDHNAGIGARSNATLFTSNCDSDRWPEPSSTTWSDMIEIY